MALVGKSVFCVRWKKGVVIPLSKCTSPILLCLLKVDEMILKDQINIILKENFELSSLCNRVSDLSIA